MKVFVSWSGEKSKAVAKVLWHWLGTIIQAIEPYMSDEDIGKGERWFDNVSTELQSTSYCIVCLTPSNLSSAWISFEAGAIASKLDDTQVTALLIELKPSDVTGPLAQFQHTEINKEDFRKLARSINDGLGEDQISEKVLEKQINAFWPDIEEGITEALQERDEASGEAQTQRTKRDLLEELINLSRDISRDVKTLGNNSERVNFNHSQAPIRKSAVPISTLKKARIATSQVLQLSDNEFDSLIRMLPSSNKRVLKLMRDGDADAALRALVGIYEGIDQVDLALGKISSFSHKN